jgi:(p)ppGpp synthase/HD superfamily hydrolase
MTWSAERVTNALRMAALAHQGQTVPGTNLPYLLHLSQVLSEVAAAVDAEPSDDAETSVLCAVLHDIVEDTATTRDEVADRFGDVVAAGVEALSKDPTLPKSAAMTDSLARIRAQPKAVWKVKLADRITNLQPPPPHWSRQKALRYREEAKEILAALGPASPYLESRLAARINQYEDHLPQ